MSSIHKEWADETAGWSNIEMLPFNIEADKRFTKCTINIENYTHGIGKQVKGDVFVHIAGKESWQSGIDLAGGKDMSHSIDIGDVWAPIVISGHISNAGLPPAGAKVTVTVEYDSITSEQKTWSDTTVGVSNFERLDFPLEDELKFTACLINIKGGSGVGQHVNGDVELRIGGEQAWKSGISLGSGEQMSHYVDITKFCESRHISWASVRVTGHISNAGIPPCSATVLVTVVKAKM